MNFGFNPMRRVGMAVCTQCGYDNRKEALFCRHCGTGLSRACPACGQE
ncbi:MAG TPA: hypothetical protein DDZ83_12530, partial [Nitrospinae bacterium]|nr:hypothetical protein [Nitrospinota bacterium]